MTGVHNSAVECSVANEEVVPTGRSNESGLTGYALKALHKEAVEVELLYARYIAIEAIDKGAAENDLKLSCGIGCWE